MIPITHLTQAPYALFYLLALGTAFAVASRDGVRCDLPPRSWIALVAAVAAAGILGSKLLRFDLSAPVPGAKTILGGVLAGTIVAFAGARALGLDRRALDGFAVAVPLGVAIGRVGCLLAGCCFGRITTLPWGIRYGVGTEPYAAQLAAGLIHTGAPVSLPVHPTQAYEALLALVVALAVVRARASLRSPGSGLMASFAALGVGRIGIEFFRTRDLAPVHGLTIVQWLIAVCVVACVVSLVGGEIRARAACRTAGSQPRAREPSRVPVLALMLAVPVLLLAGGFFTPLERTALVLLSLPALVAVADALATRAAPRSFRPKVATAAIALLALQQATPGYPRSYWSIGGGPTLSQRTHRHEIVTGYREDCDGSPVPVKELQEIRLRHASVGGSLRHTRELSPVLSRTFALRGYIGRVASHLLPGSSSSVPDEERTIGGAGATVSVEDSHVGFTLGGGAGRLGVDSATSPLFIGALRGGSLRGTHVVVGVNDLESLGSGGTAIHAGLGHGFGGLGSTAQAGFWNASGAGGEGNGLYVRATIVTPSGFEVEPFLGFGDGYDIRLALRRRIGGR